MRTKFNTVEAPRCTEGASKGVLRHHLLNASSSLTVLVEVTGECQAYVTKSLGVEGSPRHQRTAAVSSGSKSHGQTNTRVSWHVQRDMPLKKEEVQPQDGCYDYLGAVLLA